jgi:hypothetical protein
VIDGRQFFMSYELLNDGIGVGVRDLPGSASGVASSRVFLRPLDPAPMGHDVREQVVETLPLGACGERPGGAVGVLTVAEAKMVKTRMWELASGTWALLNGPGHKRQGG